MIYCKDKQAEKPYLNLKELKAIGKTLFASMTQCKLIDGDVQFPMHFTEDDVSEVLNSFIVQNYKFEMKPNDATGLPKNDSPPSNDK